MSNASDNNADSGNIAKPDYPGRLLRLRKVMAQHNANVFICDHGEMLLWLTGFSISETRYRACIVPAEGDPIWVLRTIDEAPCRQATWVKNIKPFTDDQDPFLLMANIISDLGLLGATIAADYNSYGFTAYVSETFRQALPSASWVNLFDVSNQIRACKEPVEIEKLKQAAAIADGAMTLLTEQLEPGMRPRDAGAMAAQYYLREGADDWWVGPIAISRQANSDQSDMGFLHGPLVDDVLSSGDVLHVELVPRVGCYSSRIMRSICIGPASEQMVSTMSRLTALQDKQFEAMLPGAVASEVDRVLREPVLQEGLRQSYDNATGYQIGLYTKTPRSSDFSLYFSPSADWTVQAGMTFHMYLSAQGLAISDSILVTESEPVRLTQSYRGLLSTR